MRLELRNVACGYGGRPVLENISETLESGEVLCLLGPNGSGKTTLFKAILGLLKTLDGDVLLDGESIKGWSRLRVARAMGYVPQAHSSSPPFSVLDVVLLGRTAHLGAFATPGRKDREVATGALETLGIHHLRDRIYTELSGGERQLVLVARALAQEPKLLIMDEPTASLDFGNQLMVLNQVQGLADRNLAVVMASHFPDHAFLCATKVLLLRKGKVFSSGSPEATISEMNLKELYGVDVRMVDAGISNGREVKVCVPVSYNKRIPELYAPLAGEDASGAK